MAHGIKEAMTLIRRGKQERATGFRFLDQIATDFLDHPREPANVAHSAASMDLLFSKG